MTAWDRYTRLRPASAFAWGAFELTSWPPALHFPGAEILEPRPGRRVLDLGCGDGDNAAHVAVLGPQVTAIDQSSVRVAAAHQRWGHVGNLTVVQAEAVEFMTAAGPVFDAIYSVYGAAWFTDPELLVPAAFAALRPGGLFVCSHADMDPPGGHVTLDSADIHRWDLSPRSWRMLLRANGFRQVGTTVLPPTRGFPGTFTVLVGGRRLPGDADGPGKSAQWVLEPMDGSTFYHVYNEETGEYFKGPMADNTHGWIGRWELTLDEAVMLRDKLNADPGKDE